MLEPTSDSDLSIPEDIDNILALMSRVTVPLYALKEHKGLVPHGSGFCTSHKGAFFLITAAHVLASETLDSLYYFESSNTARKLSGAFSVYTDESRDIGVVKLQSTPSGLELNHDRVILPRTYLKVSASPRKGRTFAIVGYPASKTKVSKSLGIVEVTPFSYYFESIPDSDYIQFGLNSNDHIAIPLDLKIGYDSDGRHRNIPRPHGMSGSPIWAIPNETYPDGFHSFSIAGVGTRYLAKDRLLVGTDIGFALELMDEAA